ncbi:hypothetical protein BDV40DRAFT_281526 [Aspergillus tamarii]|uniref:Uncharacterized protein n=1 Tax=Aspergillus tamarii TaxID=41984 RepID=A0A5N6UCM9_ASPTM|nr:hypothetical protein BDV40DRAFT_281526 [Aspergillus tamarii]
MDSCLSLFVRWICILLPLVLLFILIGVRLCLLRSRVNFINQPMSRNKVSSASDVVKLPMMVCT